ncbi:MAG: putative response regulatory protein [Herbinix sp.]|jgi:two-component system response regulator YesN|nr:putative response regulatory protein [Herbinix sp.]
MRIVVVEDEIRIREGICNLLVKMFPQHEVAGSAANGKDGVELILDQCPDLVITDVKMPIMDGLTMLSILNEKKMKCKAIVLSAYAEFSYAQQAIRWGVSEYLVKPLVVNDFVQAIKNTEMQLEEIQKQNAETLERFDNILLGIIFGGIEVDEGLNSFVKNKYGINQDTQFSEVQIYLGKQYDEKLEGTKRNLGGFFSKRKNLSYYFLEIPKDKLLLVVLYGYEDQQEIERWFQIGVISQIRGTGIPNSSYGWINAAGMKELRTNYYKLLQYMDWNITFGNQIMISYPKILNVQTKLCIYPIDIENRLKAALCSYNRRRVHQCLEQIMDYFESGNVYEPKNIKESYVRFLWALINVAKEINIINYDQIEQKNILERIMGSMNREELKDVMEEVCLCIKEDQYGERTELSLNVKRAENMILEYYKTGITLEEIAEKLNLTPEYLGNQFHLEKGVKFSTYIKDFRIMKAKELLIGSKLKVCEVAERVGYSDAKYFSKVFRDNTGQLPAEYRKTNK